MFNISAAFEKFREEFDRRVALTAGERSALILVATVFVIGCIVRLCI